MRGKRADERRRGAAQARGAEGSRQGGRGGGMTFFPLAHTQGSPVKLISQEDCPSGQAYFLNTKYLMPPLKRGNILSTWSILAGLCLIFGCAAPTSQLIVNPALTAALPDGSLVHPVLVVPSENVRHKNAAYQQWEQRWPRKHRVWR